MADRRPPVLALTLVGAGVAVVVLALALSRPAGSADSQDSAPRSVGAVLDDPVPTSLAVAPVPGGEPPGAVSADVPSLDTLRRLCPDLWTEGVPDDCQAALASRYGGEGMRTVRLHYDGLFWQTQSVPLVAEIPWAEAFADPTAARRVVEEALRDPSCLAFADLASMEELAWFPPIGSP